MQRVDTGFAGAGRRRVVVIGAALSALLVLGACTSHAATRNGQAGHVGPTPADTSSPVAPGSSTPAPATSSATPALAAAITLLPAGGGKTVSPAKPVVVSVAHGTLTSVTMTDAGGKKIAGRTSSDGASWSNTGKLDYSTTYRIVARAKNADGKVVVKRERVTTVTPNNMTMPYMDDIYGSSLDAGSKYGVAMVASVHFDENIPNKKAAIKALKVTTSPHVDGAWYWANDNTVHWRPQHFYAPGTQVRIDADVYGKNLGGGLYGQADASTHFTIGRKQVTVADDNAPKVDKVRVYRNGKLVRTMNTSMGKHYGEQVSTGYIDFHTMKGIYTVINFENPAIMSSASYGLSPNEPGGYAPEKIYWSTKISTDGVYLHELDSTVWDQDHGIDTSHGCLNLDYDNAKWFFQHSMIGDPVTINHTGGPLITVAQGGDWSVPWSQWVKGNLNAD